MKFLVQWLCGFLITIGHSHGRDSFAQHEIDSCVDAIEKSYDDGAAVTLPVKIGPSNFRTTPDPSGDRPLRREEGESIITVFLPLEGTSSIAKVHFTVRPSVEGKPSADLGTVLRDHIVTQYQIGLLTVNGRNWGETAKKLRKEPLKIWALDHIDEHKVPDWLEIEPPFPRPGGDTPAMEKDIRIKALSGLFSRGAKVVPQPKPFAELSVIIRDFKTKRGLHADFPLSGKTGCCLVESEEGGHCMVAAIPKSFAIIMHEALLIRRGNTEIVTVCEKDFLLIENEAVWRMLNGE